jgi:hypothetical protein
MAARVADVGDLWSGLEAEGRSLDAAIERLRGLLEAPGP